MPTYTELCDRVRAAGRDPAEILAPHVVPAERLAQLQRGEVIREGLCRTVPFAGLRAVPEGERGDGLTIEGYGAVFNSVTEINSWEGHFEESIDPGAFKKSLREGIPKMQFDHGHHPLLGGLPLGRWTTAEEDERGLHLLGRMYGSWIVEPFAEAIRDGGVDGMSFRFSVVKEKWVDKDGNEIKGDALFELLFFGAGDKGPLRRTLREVKVAEAGPVVWPAYKDTSVGARNNSTVVIDLAAMRGDPRQAAYVVAQVDAHMGAAIAPHTLSGMPRTPLERFAPIGAAGLAEMVRTVAATRRGDDDQVVHTVAVRTATSAQSSDATAEPQPTGTPAAAHSAPQGGEPRGTAEPAGTHSATPAPVPAAPRRSRRDDLQQRYRRVLGQALELPKS